jgi:hypothetical protein
MKQAYAFPGCSMRIPDCNRIFVVFINVLFCLIMKPGVGSGQTPAWDFNTTTRSETTAPSTLNTNFSVSAISRGSRLIIPNTSGRTAGTFDAMAQRLNPNTASVSNIFTPLPGAAEAETTKYYFCQVTEVLPLSEKDILNLYSDLNRYKLIVI